MTSIKPGKAVEGKVANALKEAGKDIKSFGMEIKNLTKKSPAGDIDVETANHLIEVKKSYNAWTKKKEQVNKFVDSNLSDYFNPYQKKGVLYIDTPLSAADKAKILSTIPKEVIFVNSLDELLNIIN